jgi:small glutamine-rich tetratricopeptide repeat-containing protein alpha
MSVEGKRTLIFAILKFLRDELKQESIAGDVKESLEVASQCLESSYEISVEDEICRNNFDSGLNLLELAEKSVIKRELAPELKAAADKFKTEGNELMKQEKYLEALEQYNSAIKMDANNAVYYCNRAAAYSKVQDFANSIEDCKNALKIDPTYGKAWGRLGLALLSNNQLEEAYEAYSKAIQLEPTNDGYKQNIKIVEEKLKNTVPSGMPDLGQMGNMMSMFNNPQFMNMATQLMSDPQMQNVMSNLVGNMFNQNGSAANAATAEGGESGVADAAQQSLPPMGIPGMPSMGGEAGGFDSIFQSAQNWASQMNPDFISQMRERMNINPTGANSADPQTGEKKEDEAT